MLLQGVSKILDRCCIVLGAFLFSQFPAFFQQYTQRLAGHLAELNHQLRELQHIAGQAGKTLPEYMHKFANHSDPDFAHQGTWMLNMVERQKFLSEAWVQMSQADVWARPYAFLKYLQWDIAQGTMVDFKPGLHFTLEGALYVIVGMFVGYGFYAVLHRLVRVFVPCKSE